jgi:hypothetical protein
MSAQELPPIVQELLRCRDWIDGALQYSGGTHQFEDVFQGVISGKMQLWPAAKACAITEIIVYPNKKVLHVFLAGGDMEQIVDMQKSAEEWGRTQGCAAMTIAGRKGWARVLAEHGYKEQFVTLAKEI